MPMETGGTPPQKEDKWASYRRILFEQDATLSRKIENGTVRVERTEDLAGNPESIKVFENEKLIFFEDVRSAFRLKKTKTNRSFDPSTLDDTNY